MLQKKHFLMTNIFIHKLLHDYINHTREIQIQQGLQHCARLSGILHNSSENRYSSGFFCVSHIRLVYLSAIFKRGMKKLSPALKQFYVEYLCCLEKYIIFKEQIKILKK